MPQLESQEEIARAKAAESAQARVRELEVQLAAIRNEERVKVREALTSDAARTALNASLVKLGVAVEGSAVKGVFPMEAESALDAVFDAAFGDDQTSKGGAS